MWYIFVFLVIFFILGLIGLWFFLETDTPKKNIQSKIDEWNDMYSNIDISSYTLDMPKSRRRVQFLDEL